MTKENKPEFYKKVIQDLSDIGINSVNSEDIAFLSENTSDEISVIYKFMSTGLHYKKANIKEEEVIDSGFKWWPTWNFYEK